MERTRHEFFGSDAHRECPNTNKRTVKQLTGVKLGRNGMLNVGKAPRFIEEITQANQRNSPFFRLPLEIRELIYVEVLGGLDIHGKIKWRFVEENPRTAPPGMVTAVRHGHQQDPYQRVVVCSAGPQALIRQTLYHSDKMTGKIPLDLLYVCRQIYAETRLLPFNLSLSSFANYAAFDAFLKNLRLQQRHGIRRIEMEWTVGRLAARDLKGVKEVWVPEMFWRLGTPRNHRIEWWEMEEEHMRNLKDFWEGRNAKLVRY